MHARCERTGARADTDVNTRVPTLTTRSRHVPRAAPDRPCTERDGTAASERPNSSKYRKLSFHGPAFAGGRLTARQQPLSTRALPAPPRAPRAPLLHCSPSSSPPVKSSSTSDSTCVHTMGEEQRSKWLQLRSTPRCEARMKPLPTGMAAQGDMEAGMEGAYRGRAWGGKATARERVVLTFAESPWLSISSNTPVCEPETVDMKDRLPTLPWARPPRIFRMSASSSPTRMSSST